MDRPPPTRRVKYCFGRLGWALVPIAMLVIALLGFSAASYHNWNSLGTKPSFQNDLVRDNVIVVVRGEKINLGEGTDYTFEEQIELLWVLYESPHHELSDWYLESGQERNTQDEDSNQRTQWPILAVRSQLRSSLPSLNLPPFPAKIVPIPGKPTGELSPPPSDNGEVPNWSPNPEDEYPWRNAFHPTDSPVPTAYAYPLEMDLMPSGTIAPTPAEQPAKDELQVEVHSNNMRRNESPGAHPPAVMDDTRSPNGRMRHSPRDPGAPPSEPLDFKLPGFKLPDFFHLPAKLIFILKRVVVRLSTKAAFHKEVQELLKVVERLLDRLSKSPALPAPTSGAPTLTRPPIGRKPTLPPQPTLPPRPTPPPLPQPTKTRRPGLPPIRPPRPPPGRPPPGKRPPLPIRPPPKRPIPRPPGNGEGQAKDDDDLGFDELPLSGFVEVTRRALGVEENGHDTGIESVPTPTAAAMASGDPPGPAGLLGKRPPLTKKQRQHMLGEAALLVREEIQREREKDPDDPVNLLLTEQVCMALFRRVAKNAERWMGKQSSVEREEIEESMMLARGDEEEWDYGEGE